MSPSAGRSAAFLIAAAAIAAAHAAPVRLDEVAGKAVQTNPEVLAKWHQFKASGYERDATWGRYLPTLDVLFGTAYQRQESPLYPIPGSERKFNYQTTKVSLRQNLFEGFATLNDTKRLEHASLVRFYELLDLSENAAFEATRAYIDVWRYRKLVEFAEENYATHRVLYEKIKERAQAGVGRRVDLETAAGRLALAESNLLTETSNLHDVMARYQRIVGEIPPAELVAPQSFTKDLPKDRPESVKKGFERSPQLKAAFENILSAKRNVDVQKAGYYPRVDAYLEQQHDLNASGYTAATNGTGSTNIQTAGVTVSWNLFRGMQDLSRQRKAAEDLNNAKDVREKACRDLRQTLEMAFNDHLRLSEQLQYLDQHQLSTDKAREAFRRQFDIGQRTLLDVLDTENEFYTARRNYLNGENDLIIARARYQAVSGNLLNTLNLKNLDMTPPKPDTTPDEDMLATCPADPVLPPAIDKDAIFKRAMAKEELMRSQNAAAPAAPAADSRVRPRP